jgi:hypothetical protein
MGTARLASNSAATSISSRKPISINSRPEEDARSASRSPVRVALNAAWAASASGDFAPSSFAMIEPAPTRSSKHGRSGPPSQRSPAAITSTFCPNRLAALATAEAFRTHPANVVRQPVVSVTVAPLGDGRTNLLREGSSRVTLAKAKIPRRVWPRVSRPSIVQMPPLLVLFHETGTRCIPGKQRYRCRL